MGHGGFERKLFIAILIAIIILIAYNIYELKYPKPTNNSTAIQENPAGTITSTELNCGWYYGIKDQKKDGTPNNWSWFDAGRNSIWKAPGDVDLMCK